MRRPVVGFAVDGLAEAVADGRSGILVEPGNVAALATAMLQLLGDRGDERAKSAAGRNAHVSASEQIYQRLAGHG